MVESGDSVEVCVQMRSGSASLPSGGFVTFSVSITPSTAGKKLFFVDHLHEAIESRSASILHSRANDRCSKAELIISSLSYLKCNVLFAVMDDFDTSGFPMTGNINETTSEQCFNINITDDNKREGTETFTVQFEVTNYQGNLVYDPINATVSILDDDSKCRVHKRTKQ